MTAAVDWWVDVLGFRSGFTCGDPPTHAAVLAAVEIELADPDGHRIRVG